MAYEFKRLSEVESVEGIGETANVLIEENGVVKRIPSTAILMDQPASLGKTTWFTMSDVYGVACEGDVWDETKAFNVGNPIVEAFEAGRVCIAYRLSGNEGFNRAEMNEYNFFTSSGATMVNIKYGSYGSTGMNYEAD